MDIDDKALELKSTRTPFCFATIVKSEGSSPRHAGSKMIVTADASFGTVGGGALEHEATKDAREFLRHMRCECKHYILKEEAGTQPCGGTVDIYFEPVLPPKLVAVFGAGHIAEALCPMLVQMGFDVTLIDERRERIELDAFKTVQHKINELPREFLPKIIFDNDLHVICISHAHTHDAEIVEYCLDRPCCYLGVISSRKKWEVFRKKFLEKGFTEKQLARVETPIGLDIGAETPFEIAVAIIAQLIQLHAKPKHPLAL